MYKHLNAEGRISIDGKKEDALKKLTETIALLTSCGYECLVNCEIDDGREVLYSVEYCYNQFKGNEYGSNRFMIVGCEEEEEIFANRNSNDDDDND